MVLKADHKIATPFDEKSLVWRIQPSEGYFKGAPVSGLTLDYGIVPKGYVQITPVSGTANVFADRPGLFTFSQRQRMPRQPQGLLLSGLGSTPGGNQACQTFAKADFVGRSENPEMRHERTVRRAELI